MRAGSAIPVIIMIVALLHPTRFVILRFLFAPLSAPINLSAIGARHSTPRLLWLPLRLHFPTVLRCPVKTPASEQPVMVKASEALGKLKGNRGVQSPLACTASIPAPAAGLLACSTHATSKMCSTFAYLLGLSILVSNRLPPSFILACSAALLLCARGWRSR